MTHEIDPTKLISQIVELSNEDSEHPHAVGCAAKILEGAYHGNDYDDPLTELLEYLLDDKLRYCPYEPDEIVDCEAFAMELLSLVVNHLTDLRQERDRIEHAPKLEAVA